MKPVGKTPFRLTPQERSWILYDVANSAFILIVVTTVMPIFFKDVAARDLPGAASTAYWGFANSGASLVVACLAPFLGTLADFGSGKKRFLGAFIVTGVAATLLLAAVPAGDWLLCLVVFALARVGFAGANVFYDALLVDVTDESRMDRVSAAGYGWGYIGATLPFLAVLGIVAWSGTGGGIAQGPARWAFAISALWWGLFSFPILRNVRQRYSLPRSPRLFRESLRRLSATLRDIRGNRRVFTFLLAYFFYIDGVDTIITMSAAYGRDVGLGATQLVLAILLIQVLAFPFALLYGKGADRFTGKSLIFLGIGVFSFTTLLAFALPFLPTQGHKETAFWGMAVLVATSLGGIQALSRSFFGRLVPKERSAEFFGFYNIFGKFAAITGPFLMGAMGQATGDSRYGVLSILLLFLLGGYLLHKVDG